MAPPVITTPRGYSRGNIRTDSPSNVAQDVTREVAKVERAQPNMRTVQLTEDYDVDPRDRTILVDTTAGDVTINLRSAVQQLVLPLDIIKTSADGHSVQVIAQSGESIGGPLGALTGLVWAEMGVGFSLHPDGLGQWWVEGSAVSWGSVGGLTSSAPDSIKAIADLVSGTANTFPYYTGAAAAALAALTAYARTLLDDPDAATARATLGMGSIGVRQDVVITTASLAANADESSFVTLVTAGAILLTIAVDRACRVRFYTTQAARDADLTRTESTKPTAGTGVLAEFVIPGASTVHTSPPAVLANGDGPVAKKIWYTIRNESGATHTVAVTITILPIEL